MTRTGLFPQPPKKGSRKSYVALGEFVAPLGLNKVALPDEGTTHHSKMTTGIAASMSQYPRSRLKSLLALAISKEGTAGAKWARMYDRQHPERKP